MVAVPDLRGHGTAALRHPMDLVGGDLKTGVFGGGGDNFGRKQDSLSADARQ